MLYTAFLVGFLGSFHCIGMCSPIALALPLNKKTQWNLLKSRILYNLGRITTYALLGLLIGFVGRGLVLASSQQWLSIGMGILILLAFFLPNALKNKANFLKPINQINSQIKKRFAYFFRQKTNFSYFIIGFLNGFLPCGLVYLAMAGALASGEIGTGVWYMVFFGLGTFPMMFTVSLLGNFLKPNFRSLIYKKMLPIFTLTLAIMFILRGLNLGIPYISPKIYEQNAQIQTDCCELPEKKP